MYVLFAKRHTKNFTTNICIVISHMDFKFDVNKFKGATNSKKTT